MNDIVLVLDNLRSALNVGAIMRTAAGLGIKKIYALGHTPYPKIKSDRRLPHVSERAQRQITKTSLGAKNVVTVTPINDELKLIGDLKKRGYEVISIETTPDAEPLPDFVPDSEKLALVFGHEVDGISPNLLGVSQRTLAIPMSENKESLNVASAAAIAMYHFKFKA